MPPFNVIEEEDLMSVTVHVDTSLDLSVLVDPLKEESLVRVENRLLDEQLPKTVDVVST